MPDPTFIKFPIVHSSSEAGTGGLAVFKNTYFNETNKIGVDHDNIYAFAYRSYQSGGRWYLSLAFCSLNSLSGVLGYSNQSGGHTTFANSTTYTENGYTVYLNNGWSPVYFAASENNLVLYIPYFETTDITVGAKAFLNFLNGSDPYENGGFSTEGGGTGNFDGTSDTIAIPGMPTITGLNTGFFTAFTPTQAQLQSVSQYLWTNVISDILDINTGLKEKLDALKTIVANPYDAIMGCSLIPVAPTSGGSKELKMYGIVETGITLPYASSRWVDVDCGTLNVNEYWGGYLDYSPYTKTTSLYLPYIGTVSVDVDLIMGKALQVYYRVDILSGNCVAYILIDGSVKFSYHGNCAISIPITSADYSGAIQSGLGLVGSVANIVSATGGLAAPAGAALAGAASAAISSAPSIAGNVMGMKPDIKSGGSIGGASGFLGVQKPYLIIERPKQSLPQDQFKFTGYPLNMTMAVGDCKGYTEFDMILLDGLSLTDTEKNELENIMKRGVYL